jgi:cell division protein FtsW (lipid II flippase)
MSAARTHFLVACILVIVATFSLRSRFGYVLGWLILLCGIGWLVSGEQRLQRFMELRNTDSVTERLSWSVNMNFFEIAAQYPFGNGLGGGGTSIPYFLQDRIANPVLMENEYARIMLEQGIAGLLIWILFILWLFTHRRERRFDAWYLGRRLAWVACGVYFLIGLTGTGLLTSIPQSCLFMLLIGWVGARQPATEPAQAASRYAADSTLTAQQYG